MKSGRELFATLGYDRTTAKEIARHAGVAVGSFYRYFSDKRQLLMALLQEHFDDLLPQDPQWIYTDTESHVTRMLVDHFQKVSRLGFLGAVEQLAAKDPELASMLAGARERARQRLVGDLLRIRQLGYLWPDIDPETAAWAILALVEQARTWPALAHDPERPAKLARILIRMVGPLGTSAFGRDSGTAPE